MRLSCTFKTATVERETFEGENFCELVKNTIFTEKTFVDCSLVPCQGRHAPIFHGENYCGLLACTVPRTPCPHISQRKLLRIGTKSQNSQKFSPLKVSHYMLYSRIEKNFLSFHINRTQCTTWYLVLTTSRGLVRVAATKALVTPHPACSRGRGHTFIISHSAVLRKKPE